MNFTFTDNFEGRRLKFMLDKAFCDFIYQNGAGGLVVEKAKNAHKLQKEDKIETLSSLDFINIDTWFGYSLKNENPINIQGKI